MTGELSGGELKTLYSKDFVVFEADSPGRYSQSHELRRLTSFKYTPVFVFLDEKGTKVLETRGFKSAREAKAMHEFVTKRLYRTTSLQEHLDRYPK